MVESVVGDEMAFRMHSAHEFGVGLNVLSNYEERPFHIQLAKDIQHPIRPAWRRAVVKRQRHSPPGVRDGAR